MARRGRKHKESRAAAGEILHPPKERGSRGDAAWHPRPVDDADDERHVRWWAVILIVGLATGLALFVRLALGLSSDRAEPRLIEYRDASSALIEAVEKVELALPALIAEDRDPELISSVVELQASAASLAATIAEPLPTVPPLLPSGPIDDLVGIRGRLAILADRANDTAARLTNADTYLSGVENAFRLPALPIAATRSAVAETADVLNAFARNSRTTVANLPGIAELAAHHDALEDIVEWLPTWQRRYGESLRDSDSGRAQLLIIEIRDRIRSADQALTAPLAALRRALESDVAELVEDLVAANSGIGVAHGPSSRAATSRSKSPAPLKSL